MGGDVLLLSLHSFSKVFSDKLREMEIGVLFDKHEAIAKRFADLLRNVAGFRTALNEPYSGFDDVVYSANKHGTAHGVVYLELELRQDLIDTQSKSVAIAQRIAGALARLAIRRKHR